LGAIFIGEKTEIAALAKAEKAALKEAVAHAYSQKGKEQIAEDKWVFTEGLLCFSRWIDHFRQAGAVKGMGDSYCQGIYSSTHQAAAAFLREIGPKYPQAKALLEKAADHFAQDAEYLMQTAPFIGWQASSETDAERNRTVADLLEKARDEYAQGIELIAEALPTME